MRHGLDIPVLWKNLGLSKSLGLVLMPPERATSLQTTLSPPLLLRLWWEALTYNFTNAQMDAELMMYTIRSGLVENSYQMRSRAR